ncbi:hypothetical protein [Clostridium saccharoperbutylacetonicum]|uniref:hypothetical protein n=1 Tax=Clostridium saccharoperbutylacetonicum TaxID=36745 RepID=UPI0039E95044
MIDKQKNNSGGLLKSAMLNTYIYVADSREIKDSILELISENLNDSINSKLCKTESHPPIEYYRDKINVNITYNNNINININTMPPKKPWNKLLDVVLTIVKLITLIVSLYSLGDSDDDSSDDNLRLQLA